MLNKSILLAAVFAIYSSLVAMPIAQASTRLEIEQNALANIPAGNMYNTFLSSIEKLTNIGSPTEASQEQDLVTYITQSGDCLNSISNFFGVSPKAIKACNLMNDLRKLSAGQVLKLPIIRKFVAIQPGQTLASIAKAYSTNEELLCYLNFLGTDKAPSYSAIAIPKKINNLTLTKDQKSLKRSKSSSQTKLRQHATNLKSSNSKPNSPAKRSSQKEDASIKTRGPFDWPVSGDVSSLFGRRDGRFHKGLDISNRAHENTAILATASGTISQSKYSGAYGNMITINHDGITSRYAHLSKLLVNPGEYVEKGQIIGYMGRSGDATGYHLHFELIQNDGQLLNPLEQLQ